MNIDGKSETWQEVAKHIDGEMEKISRKLMSKATSYDDTQYLRGAYAMLTQLKQLPDKQPVPLVDIDIYT